MLKVIISKWQIIKLEKALSKLNDLISLHFSAFQEVLMTILIKKKYLTQTFL